MTFKKNYNISDLNINIDHNKINEFFVNLGHIAIKNFPAPNKPVNIKKTVKNTCLLSDTNSDEIISLVNNFFPKKSCGIDGISSIMLKYVIDLIAIPLTHIINESFHCSIVSSALKLSRVIPVYKSGNKNDLINYRPISLLPIISKVIEK